MKVITGYRTVSTEVAWLLQVCFYNHFTGGGTLRDLLSDSLKTEGESTSDQKVAEQTEKTITEG